MRWSKTSHAAVPRLAAGRRIYAVGDIHGRLDLLDRTLMRIADDIVGQPRADGLIVFIGDYIDRGPDSAAVISRLIQVRERYPTVCLKGNHEAFLLDFLRSPPTLLDWAPSGGLNTLMSYGLKPPLAPDPEACVALAIALRRAIPPDHLDFLAALPPSFARDDFFFVHAGVHPQVALATQEEEHLLWIRDEFLMHRGQHEKYIVHGHTPVREPDIRPNRINIDTGAYATGTLTCLVLENDTKRFL